MADDIGVTANNPKAQGQGAPPPAPGSTGYSYAILEPRHPHPEGSQSGVRKVAIAVVWENPCRSSSDVWSSVAQFTAFEPFRKIALSYARCHFSHRRRLLPASSLSVEPHMHWLWVPPTINVPLSASERQSGWVLGDAAP
jgi:hypothetical protein